MRINASLHFSRGVGSAPDRRVGDSVGGKAITGYPPAAGLLEEQALLLDWQQGQQQPPAAGLLLEPWSRVQPVEELVPIEMAGSYP